MHLSNHFCTGLHTEEGLDEMLAKPQPDPNAVFMAIPLLGSGTQDLTSKGQSSAITQETSQLQSAAAPERKCGKDALLGFPQHDKTNTSQSATRSQGTSASDRKGNK
jgi:hypothetical protein